MRMVLMISVFAGAILATNAAQAQVKDLVGTWSLVSSDIVKPDGSKTETFGPHPKGSLIFGDDGHYALIFMRSDLPKIASGNRTIMTPEEAKAISVGLVGTYGTYTVDSKFITLHIDGATFTNWTGADQQRAYTLSGDSLIYTSPGTTGVPTQVTLHRVK